MLEQELKIEGVVSARTARGGTMFFEVTGPDGPQQCYDGTSAMGPFLIRPGVRLACMGKWSDAIKGHMEVMRVERLA